MNINKNIIDVKMYCASVLWTTFVPSRCSQRILKNMVQMTWIKWLVFFLAIPANGRFLNLQIPGDVSVGEWVMANILESCYDKKNLSNPIVIFGKFNGVIEQASSIRMHSRMNVNETHEKLQLSNVGATQIVMVEDSPEKLQSALTLLMKTRWWNYMASFFIIGSEKTACRNFKEILITAWEMNIINSIYICPEATDTAALYTLNPMSNYAPHPWRRMHKLPDLNVYSQTFHPSISCKNLNYDKTKYLTGHEIKAVVRLEDNFTSLNKFVEYTAARPHYKIFHSIISHLNATIRFNETKVPLRTKNYLESNHLDIIYSLRFLGQFPDHSFLYPHKWGTVLALTKSREKSTLTKIIHLWSPKVLFLGFVSLAILFAILAIRNQDITLAILDVTRFLVYTSIRSNTRNNSFRIYLIPMLIFIVISNGVFQGKIASFLTKPDIEEPVETFEQLIHSKYEFHGFAPISNDVKILHPEIKFKQVSGDACIAYALNGSYHACIMSRQYYNKFYSSLALENIRKLIVMVPMNFKCRDNWPLHNRFNNLIIRHIESDIYAYWTGNYTHDRTHRRKADKFALMMEDFRPVYRPIKLSRLDFAIELLATGLLLATIVFVWEMRQLVAGRLRLWFLRLWLSRS